MSSRLVAPPVSVLDVSVVSLSVVAVTSVQTPVLATEPRTRPCVTSV
jgi:hypothetical protein